MREDASVTLERIDDGDGPRVYAAEYPLPGETEGLWSQWGQGIVASTGVHYSALGDHLGPDGNSFIYRYETSSRTLTRSMDVLSLVERTAGAWGYGKIHSQMMEDSCGSIWVWTYWGTRDGLVYEDGYAGDLLLEIDPSGETVRALGPLAGERGVPSMVATGDGRYLVSEAVDPHSDDGDLVVFDTQAEEVIHQIDDPAHLGFRSLAVDADGRVLYSIEDLGLKALDARTGETVDAGIDLPGEEEWDFLRAATPVTEAGTFYGVMRESDELFSVDEHGEVEELGSAREYTASLALTPEADRVFWFPGAHGSSWEVGAPVLSLDTSTGEVTEVVSLLEPFEEALGLLPGGSYSITYQDGSLILGVNASPLGDDSGFGTVVLVVVEGM